MKKRTSVSVVNKNKDREQSILNDTPALFEIERDPKNIKWDLWDEVRTFDRYGRDAVINNDRYIQKHAEI